jgi:hypothetical protein
MKYLHSGYILFCKEANYEDNGLVNATGLFDVFVEKSFPAKIDCVCIVGFGTPYERRQYKGLVTIEDPDGEPIYVKDFHANDPNDIYKGHYIFKPELNLSKEGAYSAKVTLLNWKDDTMWDCERQFWAMVEGEAPPDP